MATVASRLLRYTRACRAAAAAASRSAATASRSARAAVAGARTARSGLGEIAPLKRKSRPTPGCASTKACDEYIAEYEYDHVPDDAKIPTEEDFKSDEAARALYERWCKAFNKERDPAHAETDHRFKLFTYNAKYVHNWNAHLPPDPEEAAIFAEKRREAKLCISKGESVTRFEEWHIPMDLGPLADGEERFLSERSMRLLKSIEGRDPFGIVPADFTAE